MQTSFIVTKIPNHSTKEKYYHIILNFKMWILLKYRQWGKNCFVNFFPKVSSVFDFFFNYKPYLWLILSQQAHLWKATFDKIFYFAMEIYCSPFITFPGFSNCPFITSLDLVGFLCSFFYELEIDKRFRMATAFSTVCKL